MPQLLTTPWSPRDPTWLADIVRSGQNIQLQRQQLAQAQQRIAMEEAAQQARESQFWAEQKRLADQQAFQDRKFKWDMQQDILNRQRQETMDAWNMNRQDKMDKRQETMDKSTIDHQRAVESYQDKMLSWTQSDKNPANIENAAQAKLYQARADELMAPSPYDAPQNPALTPQSAPAAFMGPPAPNETNPYLRTDNPITGTQQPTGLNEGLPQGGPGPVYNPLLPSMEDNQSNPFTMPMISRQLPDGSTAVSFAVPDRRGKTAYVSSPTIVNRPASATKGTTPIQKAIDDEQQNFNSLVSQANIPDEKMRPTPDSLNASRQRLADLQWAQNADFTDFRIDTDTDPALRNRVGTIDPEKLTEYGRPSRPKIEQVRAKLEAAANDPKMPMESRNLARDQIRKIDVLLGSPQSGGGASRPASAYFSNP